MSRWLESIRDRLSHRNLLIGECLILFLIVPLVAWLEVFRVSVFVIFAVPVLYALLMHVILYGFRIGRFKDVRPGKMWKSITEVPWYRIGAVTLFIGACAYLFEPENFLILPRERYELWLIILMGYPIISAMPQEFLYRVYFFRRYRKIWNEKVSLIGVNILSFGLLHVMYDNWVAPVMTLAGGVLFATSWASRQNFLAIWIEHSAYGLAIFTFGLGRYFYEAPGG